MPSDVEFEFDDEIGFNFIFFYNTFDRGGFTGHENEWVTVHNQKVVDYGKEYSDDQLNYVLETMPGAIQLPVRIRVRRPNENNLIAIFSYDFYDTMNNNKEYTCVVDTGAPESILPYHVKRILGRKGWSTNPKRAGGYEAPAGQFYASEMFELSIGDDNNWSKWVQAKILLWEYDPSNQVKYALVGNDVTDKLAYVHEPGNPLKFLDIGDETRLTTFLNTRR
ncbi:4965_t:CDS:2 [Entrophospora sp. SA101]|nr:4965_t:CDS:2 [Entrophospora sp. SA101]CAJ0831268.1 13343_t:CDS:2 [Entrophospora sp. SA101]